MPRSRPARIIVFVFKFFTVTPRSGRRVLRRNAPAQLPHGLANLHSLLRHHLTKHSHLPNLINQLGNRFLNDLDVALCIGIIRIQLQRAFEIAQRTLPFQQRRPVGLQRAPRQVHRILQFPPRAAPIQIRGHHLLNIHAWQHLANLVQRAIPAIQRPFRLPHRAARFRRFLQFLRALLIAHVPKIV